MKVYTKKGDSGNTSLFGGKRVKKDDAQIECYGTVDELNSFIGILISILEENHACAILKQTQSILFDIGSHLSSDGTAAEYLPQLQEVAISQLESEMDQMTEVLPPLKSFIMPGGNLRISYAHVCRTICRRAERRVVTLAALTDLDPFVVTFLNRLSDYFFVLARHIALTDGVDETKWNPK